jgi:hypothetical protein
MLGTTIPVGRRHGLLVGMLAAITIVAVAGLAAVAFQFYRPIRLPDGSLGWVHVNTYNWDGIRCRDYYWRDDWIVRREFDLDGDGALDCREDDCPSKSETRWTWCVSRRVDGKWQPQPSDVLDCGAPMENPKESAPASGQPVTPSAPSSP